MNPPPREIPTGFWLVLGFLIACVLLAVCAVGGSAVLGTPSPASSTRSTP